MIYGSPSELFFRSSWRVAHIRKPLSILFYKIQGICSLPLFLSHLHPLPFKLPVFVLVKSHKFRIEWQSSPHPWCSLQNMLSHTIRLWANMDRLRIFQTSSPSFSFLGIFFFSSSLSFPYKQATPLALCLEISGKYPISLLWIFTFNKTPGHNSANFSLTLYNKGHLSSSFQ